MDMQRYSHELHARAFKPRKYSNVITRGLDDIWSIDLADMAEWHGTNDEYKYILCVIDCFSRYAWTVPLMTKSAADVWKAFESIVEESGRVPSEIWADQGKEWMNKTWKTNLKKMGVEGIYHTYSPVKAVMIERFIQTLKHKLWLYMTRYNNRVWIKYLDDCTFEYNAAKHTALGMSPGEASDPAVESKLWDKQYSKKINPPLGNPKYELGTMVRVSRVKKSFEKGIFNWTPAVYKIVGIHLSEPVMYRLADFNGKPIEGSFYESEVQPTTTKDIFLVDHVVKTRKKGNKTEYLIRWLGHGPEWDSWTDEVMKI